MCVIFYRPIRIDRCCSNRFFPTNNEIYAKSVFAYFYHNCIAVFGPQAMKPCRAFWLFLEDDNGNRSFRQRVSSLTTSSLILKSIRQRLIVGTNNTVNRSLCNYTRNQSNTFTAWLEICDRFNGLCSTLLDFVDMRVNTLKNTSPHVIKQT